jgi:segregation and condensation protein B
LDHFGLESARDLPGIKELRAAGLLDNRIGQVPGPTPDPDDQDEAEGQTEMFED